ncbi:HRDC domain-containing protein [Desulforhopalus sp. IMCC35007]|uniref:ribonuclease D n=1 Tax=Desulforhopalus sp. IMCC35007 TaxID=2569543 RepID=UPI0010AE6925|nr:HRDC domain-containing protein [Desulforhopalus sp. IMCC35007]TKB09103.1 ribonuclease D [Desulforhopalus sp. IMCC35007]
MEKLNTLIQNEKDLDLLVQKARQTDAVALDTEFVWERTYYPQLGLIQIALSDEECYLIDPLAIKDLSALGKLLSDRGVVKILHDAPQDLAILQRATGATPQNIFDTRLAAGFSDLSATLSLGNLIKELLDIDLAKNETRTNWLMRPLTKAQVDYALDDVRYLRAIRIILLTRIIGPKIKSWLQEELNLLNNPATYNGVSSNDRYLKVRGSNSLNRRGLAVLKNLATWRDGTAQKLDRPRGHIISDTNLVEISKSCPQNAESLKEKTSLSDKAVTRYAANITAIVSATLDQDPALYPEPKKPTRLTAGDKQNLEKLNGLITLKCDLLGIAPSLVGNSSELKQLIKTLRANREKEVQQLRQASGWRKSFLEDFFRQNREK